MKIPTRHNQVSVFLSASMQKEKDMKKILLIATGGTIASSTTDCGLAPELTSEELLSCVPEVKEFCDVDAVQLFNLDSTNMCWRQWLRVSETIAEQYDKYDGFVVTHGTDTLAYAASTLSYLIQNNRKPVVLTGAQKSVCDRDTDGRRNLYEAFAYAADDRACGTHVVFDGRVIVGTRARKTRTKSFNAFSSIDYPEAAVFKDKRLVFYIDESPEYGVPVFYNQLCPDVIAIRLTPGMNPAIFDYISTHYKGVIIESFGVGGIPYYEDDSFSEKIGVLLKADVRIVMTTQVPHEGCDMAVYRVGYLIKHRYNLLEASDMTTESILAKMMWALAQTGSEEEFKALFSVPVGKDRL